MSNPSQDPFAHDLAALIPRLRRFARSLCRDAVLADDLAQQALERAWRARSSWTPGTRLDSWVFQILRRIWIDDRRAAARTAQVLTEEPEVERVGVDPRPQLEARRELSQVRRALARLPDEQREAVSLVLIEGYGYDEAAQITGVPIGTFSSRLVRGRRALLALLDEA
ncbi:MAG: RNA polymerase sigma factor [Alphaproteobacteria bacterium]|nr:RNA polymerase sigma factor [Alphaproteobacteria bacterium]